MKRTLTIIALMSAIIMIACLNQMILWPITGIRYTINSEYICVMRWTTHGYDSWGFEYSHGHQYQSNGIRKNLWHYPTWRRAHWKFSSLSKATDDTVTNVNSGCFR